MSDDEIFAAAIECDTQESQETSIRALSGHDLHQAARVLQLLHSHRRLNQTSNACSASVLDRPREVFQTFSDTGAPKPGQRIGNYVLRHAIGEGATSHVYQAQCLTSSPNPNDVAIKLLKPGMDSQRILARFALEHRLLAQLEHPGIVRIMATGVQENGRPYFAMELVRSPKTITDYACQNGLDLKERITLMNHVCQIVQHAHQRGIIHRDLKPSNILLEGQSQTAATPKIIDFGIAKILNTNGDASRSFTTWNERFGTPGYMSPEQALLSSDSVDIRSDVYSLGVIFYELITGHLPRNPNVPNAVAPWTQNAYWDDPIPLPSQKLQIAEAGQDSTLPAKALAQWHSRQARMELDSIASKALARDMDLRYQSVADFQRDLQRYLDGQPVEAAGPGFLYHVRKLIGRNRVVTAASLLVTLTILATSIITSWYALRARRAEQFANDRLQAMIHAQKELTLQRDNADKAKRQAQALLRAMQVQNVTERAISKLAAKVVESLESAKSTGQPPLRFPQSVEELELLTRPHDRLMIHGNWSWATQRFPIEMINAGFRLTSGEVAQALPSQNQTNHNKAANTAASDVATSALESPQCTGQHCTGQHCTGQHCTSQPTSDLPVAKISSLDSVLAENRNMVQQAILEELKVMMPHGDPFVAELLDNFGLAALDRKQLPDAEAFLREAMCIWNGDDAHSTNLVQTQLFLAETLQLRNDAPQADDMLRAARRTLDRVSAAEPGRDDLITYYEHLRQKQRSL